MLVISIIWSKLTRIKSPYSCVLISYYISMGILAGS